MNDVMPALPEVAEAAKEFFPRPDDLVLRAAVRVPLRQVTLRQLRSLKAGAVVEGNWPASSEVPLALNGAQVAWGEFCVANEEIAVRLTRLFEV